MKNILALLLITLGCIAMSAAAKAETITIAADPWCPYTCDPKSERPGFIVELAQQAFKKHNIEVKYVVQPWARAIAEAREGKLHAIAGASKGDAPDFVYPSVTQGEMGNAFYVKEGSAWRYTGLESLAKICVGAITDYSYSEAFNQYAEKHKNDPSKIQYASGDNPLDINVKKLLAGRIDAVIETTLVMKYYLATHPEITGIIEAGHTAPSVEDKLYIAFSPQNPESKKYAKILSDETVAMRKSGELQTLLKAYNIEDWDKRAK